MSNCNQVSVLGVIYDIEDSTARTGLDGKANIIHGSNHISTGSDPIPTASASQEGLLSATDWSDFDGKQDEITSSNKLDATLIQTSDSNQFVSSSEKATWNGKADPSDIPTALSELTDDATHRLVTDTEKSTWTAKQSAITSSNPLDADLVDDDDSTHKFVSSSEKTRWNNKQNAISSSNMLDADFVDDSDATHKFVTSSQISTWNAKQNALTFDDTPTASSDNPVKSSGIKTALDTKQNTLTFDSTPTASSSNPVTSAGIRSALDSINASQITAGTLASARLPSATATAIGGVTQANSVTYYVSVTGNDTTGDGTSSNPFREISKAISSIPAVCNYANIYIGGTTSTGTYTGFTVDNKNISRISLILQGDVTITSNIDIRGTYISISGTSTGITLTISGGDHPIYIRNGSYITIYATNIDISSNNVSDYAIYVNTAELYCFGSPNNITYSGSTNIQGVMRTANAGVISVCNGSIDCNSHSSIGVALTGGMAILNSAPLNYTSSAYSTSNGGVISINGVWQGQS